MDKEENYQDNETFCNINETDKIVISMDNVEHILSHYDKKKVTLYCISADSLIMLDGEAYIDEIYVCYNRRESLILENNIINKTSKYDCVLQNSCPIKRTMCIVFRSNSGKEYTLVPEIDNINNKFLKLLNICKIDNHKVTFNGKYKGNICDTILVKYFMIQSY